MILPRFPDHMERRSIAQLHLVLARQMHTETAHPQEILESLTLKKNTYVVQ